MPDKGSEMTSFPEFLWPHFKIFNITYFCMNLKEIKKVARLLDMMSEYENAHAIVSYMMNDSGFTEAQVLRMVNNIRDNVNLFLFEIMKETVYSKGSKSSNNQHNDVKKYII